MNINIVTYPSVPEPMSTTSYVLCNVQGCGPVYITHIFLRGYVSFAQISVLFAMAICEYKFHLFRFFFSLNKLLSLPSLLEMQLSFVLSVRVLKWIYSRFRTLVKILRPAEYYSAGKKKPWHKGPITTTKQKLLNVNDWIN